MDRRELGRIGEQAAAAHLEALGYRILARNVRCPLGEIDLVASDGPALVFVEVKARTSDAFGAPLEAITARKQRRLARLAAYYLKGSGRRGATVRFDAVAVTVAPDGRPRRVEHLIDAFGSR